jgi:parallel beta-helix repeat protein
MRRKLCRWALVFLAWLFAASLSVAAQKKAVLSVADFFRPESPTCGIQEAIDALPPSGGVVVIPPGTYRLRRATVLRSHVTLRGSGPTSILTRGKEVHAKLTAPARKGETSVEVETTKGLRAGDEVALLDNRMRGWYMAHCLIKAVEPRRLTFAAPIVSGHKEGVFDPKRAAVVVNYFPFIRGSRMHSGKRVVDVGVLDLTLDGNRKENPGPWSCFTLSAIHFANVSDAVVRGVTVRGSVGDGIGVQGGADNRVESCLVEHCRGHGLHPGTSLRGGVFANNISRHNGRDGLYFCWQVVGITVTNNLFHDNGGSGIGGLGEGGKGGDRFNVVSNNVCRNNGRWGIQAVRGHNNVISGNICLDNSRSKPGRYSGIYVADTTHTVISGNRCGTYGGKPTQKYGIEEHGKSDANVFSANICAGNLQGGIAVVGKRTQLSANVGTIARR